MSPISSNTLFHFTQSDENLISILANEFQPMYCMEKFTLGDKKIEIAIPMICFCDIPLSQIKNHIETYGVYGLGMSKEWAKKNGLNPILYLKEKSSLSNYLLQILDNLQKDEISDLKLKEIIIAYLKILRYIKPFEGDFLKDSTLLKSVRFYDEREWRYTPESTYEIPLWLVKEVYDNPISRAQENEKLKAIKLSFEPNDISYIIVNKENEIFPMINELKNINGKYNNQTLEILKSRIITCDQIFNDF